MQDDLVGQTGTNAHAFPGQITHTQQAPTWIVSGVRATHQGVARTEKEEKEEIALSMRRIVSVLTVMAIMAAMLAAMAANV